MLSCMDTSAVVFKCSLCWWIWDACLLWLYANGLFLGFELCNQKCPVPCPLLIFMACQISVSQKLMQFPCYLSAALSYDVVCGIRETFLQTCLTSSVYSPPQWNAYSTKNTQTLSDNTIFTTLVQAQRGHCPLHNWLKDSSGESHRVTWLTHMQHDSCVT
jgi:hypothetical protein